MTKINK